MSTRSPRHRRPRTANPVLLRTGIAAGTAAAAVLAAAAGAVADTGKSGDARAESFDGNVTSCGDGDKGAGVGGKEYGDDQGEDPAKVVTYTGEAGDTYLSISAIKDGFDVIAVAVKGGKFGYNLYKPADLGELPWEDLHAPLNKDKPAAISHFLICAKAAAPSTPPTEDGGGTPSTSDDQGGEDTTPGDQGGEDTTPGDQGGEDTTPGDQGGEDTTPGDQGGADTTPATPDEDDGDEESAQAPPPAAGTADNDSEDDSDDDGEVKSAQIGPKKDGGKKLPKTGGGDEAALALVGSLLVGAGAMLVGSGGGGGRHRASSRRGAHRRA